MPPQVSAPDASMAAPQGNPESTLVRQGVYADAHAVPRAPGGDDDGVADNEQ